MLNDDTLAIASKVDGSTVWQAGKATSKIAPNLGRKMDYIFGKASGSIHNMERSRSMGKQLSSIGIFDNQAGRAYVSERIIDSYYNSTAILQDNGRYLRETMLVGDLGALKMQTIWEGENLITIFLYQ